MTNEEKWIRKIKRRNSREAADCLVRAYYDEIYVYVYRQTGEKEVALDLTQEIFISMLQSIYRYESKKASFRTWLYRIATNKIIDFRRKYKPVMIDMEDLELLDELDFTEQSVNRYLLQNIEEYVSELDEEIQRIFRLRLYQNSTFPEISEILSLPEATVKTKYHRLIQKIRKEFYDEYYNAK